jgi:hypothetical protein
MKDAPVSLKIFFAVDRFQCYGKKQQEEKIFIVFTKFSTDCAEFLLTGLWNMFGVPSLSCR